MKKKISRNRKIGSKENSILKLYNLKIEHYIKHINMIQIKRVYDPPENSEGERILVKRPWPRGMSKEKFKLNAWLKEAAPSTELRKWFSHDPAKWKEFQRRYRAELDSHPDAWQPIMTTAKKSKVTLLFSSHDATHNNVVALKEYLEN